MPFRSLDLLSSSAGGEFLLSRLFGHSSVRGFGGFNCGGGSSDRVASRKAVALVDHMTACVNSMWLPAWRSQQFIAGTVARAARRARDLEMTPSMPEESCPSNDRLLGTGESNKLSIKQVLREKTCEYVLGESQTRPAD